MFDLGILLILMILIPVLVGIVFFFLELTVKNCFILMISTLALSALLGLWCIAQVWIGGPLVTPNKWILFDQLSAYSLLITIIVYSVISIYTLGYFREDIHDYHVTNKKISNFNGLWLISYAAMNGVLVANNIATMWVGIEAITLVTTFLICFHKTKTSLEAMWKYVLICSVGIALAFIGIIFISMSYQDINADDVLFWTFLRDKAVLLNPGFIKIGFIFILIGYGTKAGLAPMHNWLPDAHSQAPSPVSAMFSGLMLNTALYCIMRFLPIVNTVTNNSDWACSMMRLIGLISIIVAAIFISFQTDIKRLLAYSSVEHMGIIALALGLGKGGAFIALFHTFNHAIAKTLAFISAGRVIQDYKSQNINDIGPMLKTSPPWGLGLCIAMLALVGMAPFSIFMSKLMLFSLALDQKKWWALVIFIAGSATVFIIMLKQMIKMAWTYNKKDWVVNEVSFIDNALVYIFITISLVVGLWLPEEFADFIKQAAAIINNKD
jgi:hydrogenase-4 component F